MPDHANLHNSPGYRLIIAGGGTGGHLFPGIAVAQAFVARNPNNRILFVNAGRTLEAEVLSRLGWPRETISIEGIKGRSFIRKISAALKIPGAIWHSDAILKGFKADAVLGVGGYSAGPVVVAAWRKGIPTALHEQNQLPGLTNRMVRRIVDQIYLSFADSANRFDPRKAQITGNPVRDEIVVLGNQGVSGADKDTFTVLVIGGSQGAHAINEAIIQALPQLKAVKGLRLLHQTGLQDESWIRKTYIDSGLQARAQAFFNDMAECYRQADLVICRAGATTVAEITAIGKATVFIPFPFAADDHQTHNARALVDAGAARMIAQKDLNGRALADVILQLSNDRDRLAEMAANARILGRPEAALSIVKNLYRLIENGK
jgi:UDP-N-acetylglucosamine--N-acetylmuramyl-(pentapeptide) pyrophosphoryl-undecaprenol N-acetylglucosamine transferase